MSFDLMWITVFAATYIIVMPILLRLIAYGHKKLITDKQIEKAGRNAAALKKIKQPIWQTWKKYLSFTLLEDKRLFDANRAFGLKKKEDEEDKKSEKKDEKAPENGITNKQFVIIVWFAGLIVFTATPVLKIWYLPLIAMVIFFISIAFGITLGKPLLDAKEAVIQRMHKIALMRLSVPSDMPMNEAVQVLQWSEFNPVKPLKVKFYLDDNFSSSSEGDFLRQFNQSFGRENAWVATVDLANGEYGWDYEKNELKIHSVPPLPMFAKLHERHILSDGIAWSFFPIAVGVEGGVELPNPETGEIEHVIGFDVAGMQKDAAKDAGIVADEMSVTTAPMVFIGGTTGGGKAAAIDTPIRVRRKIS